MSGPDPGWYDDPENDSKQRWWDGDMWGSQTKDKAGTQSTFGSQEINQAADQADQSVEATPTGTSALDSVIINPKSSQRKIWIAIACAVLAGALACGYFFELYKPSSITQEQWESVTANPTELQQIKACETKYPLSIDMQTDCSLEALASFDEEDSDELDKLGDTLRDGDCKESVDLVADQLFDLSMYLKDLSEKAVDIDYDRLKDDCGIE